MDEFALIRKYFTRQDVKRGDVALGVGDDAALLRVPPGQELVVTTDSLVSGVHFPEELDPAAVGHRSLAANLSDLAAMGATPAWVLLALTLPKADEHWLEAFSRGFFDLAKRHQLALVGGNVARGPLNVTITAQGLVPEGQALTRTGARVGDLIYVTGNPGEAAAGLILLQEKGDVKNPCVRRFTHPEPRIAAGQALRGLASACIDVSDGLLADLGHLLDARGFGAKIGLEELPLSKDLLGLHGLEEARGLALTGGDDYELCFMVHVDRAGEAERRVQEVGCTATCIGAVEGMRLIECVDGAGRRHEYPVPGYRHF